jgi:hypothetical protein
MLNRNLFLITILLLALLQSTSSAMLPDNKNNDAIFQSIDDSDINAFTHYMQSCTDINEVRTNHPSWPMYNSCIHYAAAHGNIPMMQLFLKYQANINLKRNNGSTPLHIAVYVHCHQTFHSHNFQNNAPAIQFLLEAGADPDIKDDNNKTPFDLALTNKDRSIAYLFIHHLQKKCLALEQKLQQWEQKKLETLVASIPMHITKIATISEESGFRNDWTAKHKALWDIVQNNGILLGRK